MRAGHGTVGLGQLRQQPFHFILLERHVDLDGSGRRWKRRCGPSSPDSTPALRGQTGPAVRAACAQSGGQPRGSDLYRDAAGAEGPDFESVLASSSAMSAKTACWATVSSITSGSRRWLSTLRRPLFQIFEQYVATCCRQSQTFGIYRQDEEFANLAHGFEPGRGQVARRFRFVRIGGAQVSPPMESARVRGRAPGTRRHCPRPKCLLRTESARLPAAARGPAS